MTGQPVATGRCLSDSDRPSLREQRMRRCRTQRHSGSRTGDSGRRPECVETTQSSPERYNYMKAGEELMKDSPMVSLAADAVSVASDHILNCFLWHPVQKKAVHLPPQVPRLGIT